MRFAPSTPSPRPTQTHVVAAWDALLAPTTTPIGILAHSNGGHCTRGLLRERGESLLPRLAGIAFTDANSLGETLPPPVAAWANGDTLAVNWCASTKPLGTPLGTVAACVAQRSAGHSKHVYTTAASRAEFHPWLAGLLLSGDES